MGRVGECGGQAQGPGDGAAALALAGELRQCGALCLWGTGSSVGQPVQESHRIFFFLLAFQPE